MSRLLPLRLPGHLLRLHHTYDRNGNRSLRDILSVSHVAVVEDVNYDNWNGGTYGHDVYIFLPMEEIINIDPKQQEKITESILSDLRTISASTPNEYYNALYIELASEADETFQRSVPLLSGPRINPSDVSFWKPGLVRLFVSHRDAHKNDVRRLGDELESCGISCFVAHDTIRPMSEWRHEIMKGLATMEAMLIYLTDDFEESPWTNQEVGFALGRGIPVISLKLGKKDPPGFISHVQAKRGAKDHPDQDALSLLQLVGKALGDEPRLWDALVTSFCATRNFPEAKIRFERMSQTVPSLTEEQAARIKGAFDTRLR